MLALRAGQPCLVHQVGAGRENGRADVQLKLATGFCPSVLKRGSNAQGRAGRIRPSVQADPFFGSWASWSFRAFGTVVPSSCSGRNREGVNL